MKKILGLLLLASVVIFTGCHDDKVEFIPEKPDVPEFLPDKGMVTLTVDVSETLTDGESKAGRQQKSRVGYSDESLGFTWETGDKIAVLGFRDSTYLGPQVVTLKSGEGTSTGTFEAARITDATRYVVFYKPEKLNISYDGTFTMDYDGQEQLDAASTQHLRDYLLLQSADISPEKFNSGTIELHLANSIMRFNVKGMREDVGDLEAVEWVNAYGTDEARSMTLRLQKESVKDHTLSAFFCFNPDSMQVAEGTATGLIIRGKNLYQVLDADADGRVFNPGSRYETVIDTKPAEGVLSDWKRIQMGDEIWVKPVADEGAAETPKPVFTPAGYAEAMPVDGTSFWCYKFINGKTVTEIPDELFKGASDLAAIVLPKTVTSVGNQAFEDCSSLNLLCMATEAPCMIGTNLLGGVPTEGATLIVSHFFQPQVSGLIWHERNWKVIIILNANGEKVDTKPVKSELWVRTRDGALPPTIEGFTLAAAKDPVSEYWKYTSATDVTRIADNLFGGTIGKSAITEIMLPEGIKAIGAGAFENCTGLTKMNMPAAVTTFGDKAFRNCEKLTVIELPEGLTALGNGALENCTGLKEIVLPESLLTLGNHALNGCSQVKELTLPEKLKEIGAEAISGRLATLTVKALPGLKVDADAFGKEKNLPTDLKLDAAWYSDPHDKPVGNVWMGYTWKSVTFFKGDGSEMQTEQECYEIWFTTTDKVRPDRCPDGYTLSEGLILDKYWSFIETKGNVVTCVPDEAFAGIPVTTVVLPEGVTRIGNAAFKSCSTLTEIDFSAEITELGAAAFEGCTGLKEVTLPEKLTTLGKKALKGCTGLKELVLPAKLARIGAEAIDTKLDKLVVMALPGVEIDADAFGIEKVLPTYLRLIKPWYTAPEGKPVGNVWMGYTWGDINFITAEGEIVQTEQESSEIWFTTTDKVRPTKAPDGFSISETLLLDKYWSFKAKDGKTITTVPANAFEGISVTSVILPEEVTRIGDAAFKDCTALPVIELPEGVEAIGASSFEGCTAFTHVALPAAMKRIGAAAFKGCSKLTGVSHLENIAELGEAAFMDCSMMDKITLPDAITALEASTFENCSNLQQLILPKGFTSFGDKALKGCDKLGTFTLPSSVTSLGSEAFACVLTKLTVKALPGLKVADDAFGKDKNLPTELNLLDKWYTATEGRPVGNVWMGYTWKPIRYINGDGGASQIKPGTDEIWFTTVDNVRPARVPEGYVLSDEMFLDKYWSFKAVDGNPITVLQDGFFADMPVTSVILPETLTTIGKSAFENCESLTTIDIPKHVKTIGEDAFQGCSDLENFSGKFATEDGYALIQDNTLLTFVQSGVSEYTIPSTITAIAPKAFYGSDLVKVTLPDGLREIGAEAFANCPNLKQFVGEKVKGDGRFVVINQTLVAFAPAGVKEVSTTTDFIKIAPQVFSGCNELTTITVGSWIRKIGERAFEDCKKVQHVIVHANNETELGADIFGANQNLNAKLSIDYTWKLPESTNKPANNRWNGYNWKEIQIVNEPPIRVSPDPNEIWVKTEGADVVTRGGTNKGNKQPLFTPAGFKKAVKVYGQDFWSYVTEDGNPVIMLSEKLFKDAKELVDIFLPHKITSIGKNVFEGCNKVKQITMQEGITTIGESAFTGCSDLTDVIIPDGVKSIGTKAFSDCGSLTVIVIPEGVESLGDQAFQNCTDLEKVELPTTLEKVEPNILEGCDKVEEVKVPGTKIIEKHAFANLKGLQQVEIDEGVEIIRTGAFYNCESLSAVVLPKSIVEIEENAFQGCNGIQKLMVKAPYMETINESSFLNLPYANIFLYLNKDWTENPDSQGIDRPHDNWWQGYEWKGIGDIISSDVEIEDPGDSENGFQ